MRLLIDTNIFLEILLDQSRAEEAKELLRKVDRHDFFISDFALHSVGLLLLRQRKPEVFRSFLSDMISNAGIIQLGLSPLEMEEVIEASRSTHRSMEHVSLSTGRVITGETSLTRFFRCRR